MTVPLQKRGEGRDDLFLNEGDELFQEDIEIFVRTHRLWFERYMNREIVAHLHLHFHSHHLCSVQVAGGSAGLSPTQRQLGGIPNSPIDKGGIAVGDTSEYVQGPVFVETVEFVDDPQRVARRVRSEKWLQPVELCVSPIRDNTPDLPKPATARWFAFPVALEVPVGVEEDRELGVIRRVPRSTRQREHDVVKSRTEVVDAVPSDGGPKPGDICRPFNVAHLCGTLILGDDVEGVRLATDEAIQLGLESVQMIFRSINLDPYLI